MLKNDFMFYVTWMSQSILYIHDNERRQQTSVDTKFLGTRNIYSTILTLSTKSGKASSLSWNEKHLDIVTNI